MHIVSIEGIYQGCSDQYGWYSHGCTIFLRAVGSGVAGEAMAVPLVRLVPLFRLWIAHCCSEN